MTRKILTQEEARKILEPYSEKIQEALQDGFNEYLQIRRFIGEGIGVRPYKIGARATLVHEHIKSRIVEAFRDEVGVQTVEIKGVFGIIIQGELFIRFKKFKPGFELSGTPTRQSKGYQEQLNISGFPDQPTFLYAGYMPDRTWTGIVSIHIVCWEGLTKHWDLDLVSGSSTSQGELFPLEDTQTQTRVRVKTSEQTPAKTGTEG